MKNLELEPHHRAIVEVAMGYEVTPEGLDDWSRSVSLVLLELIDYLLKKSKES